MKNYIKRKPRWGIYGWWLWRILLRENPYGVRYGAKAITIGLTTLLLHSFTTLLLYSFTPLLLYSFTTILLYSFTPLLLYSFFTFKKAIARKKRISLDLFCIFAQKKRLT